MIYLREALMTGERLPYDAEVEYLESTGTQYVDTGYRMNNNCRIELLVSAETTTGISRNVFGCRTSFASKNFSSNSVPLYGYTVDFNNSNTTAYRVTVPVDTRFIAHIVADKDERTIYNETTGATIATNATPCPDVFTCDYSAYLFHTSGSPFQSHMMVGRMYFVKMWDNGVLVRDFIPVRFTNENGVTEGAMFDKVSGTLFRNAGTGAFVIGPDASAANGGGGYKRQCVRRSHTRSWRPSARFYSPRLWKEVA